MPRLEQVARWISEAKGNQMFLVSGKGACGGIVNGATRMADGLQRETWETWLPVPHVSLC